MKMKKLVAIIAAALVLTTSAVCLTACGGGDTNSGTGTVVEQQTASLAGTKWDITGMSVNGQVYSVEELEQMYGSELEMYYSFTDTTVTSHLMGETFTTDYTFENGVVTIDGESTTVVNDTMTFVVDGETVMLKKSGSASTAVIGGTDEPTSIVVAPTAQNPVANTTWDIVEVTMEGTTMTKEQMESQLGQSLEMYFTFTDSTVTYNLMGETDTTDYTYEDGVVTIDGVSSTINGNTMHFSPGGGESYKLVKR